MFNFLTIDKVSSSLVACGAVALSFFYIFGRKKTFGIPLVEGGLPFFGHVFDMLKSSPWDIMTSWMNDYGLIYRFRFIGNEGIVVCDPEILKIILSSKLSSFKKDTQWTYKPFMDLLGFGLVTSEGSLWRSQRTLLSHKFRVEILSGIPDMAYRAVRRLCTKLNVEKNQNTPVEMAEEFRHLTLQVVAEAILSLPAEESDKNFAKMYLPIVTEGNERVWQPYRMYLPSPSWFKFRNDVYKLNSYIEQLIHKRWGERQKRGDSHVVTNSGSSQPAANEKLIQNDSRADDILDITLGALPLGVPLTGEILRQARDEVKTFILAGHETSASMLTWALYEICQNPVLLQRVREEAAAVFGVPRSADKDLSEWILAHPPPPERLQNLTVTANCLKEALRKYSVVPTVVRIAKEDLTVGEVFLPKGSTLMVHIQGVHHNPSIWANPLEFNPDRFLSLPEPFTFLPFIEGPRNCLGQHLSLLESKIVLAILLLSYDFQVVNADAGEKHPRMVPITPKSGLFVTVF